MDLSGPSPFSGSFLVNGEGYFGQQSKPETGLPRDISSHTRYATTYTMLGFYGALVIFHELCLGKCWELMAKFDLLKTRTSIDIFSTEKCKVSFGLKYICICI